ncbi:hypothetical protein ACFS5L_39015 [Streptomyces phyllanthi]|uniref:hypothetical protein n=1 Tax=Streptomyces phyllanthi TaxID=1803180 RepID=UPI001D159292|nr:hypothetical protein [Streptomyces phyllanthi]
MTARVLVDLLLSEEVNFLAQQGYVRREGAPQRRRDIWWAIVSACTQRARDRKHAQREGLVAGIRAVAAGGAVMLHGIP